MIRMKYIGAYFRGDGECDSRYGVPEFEYRQVLFKECAVAGVSFHVDPDDELWEELYEGAEVALVRERSNPHDSNAVAIALADDYGGDPDSFDFDFILGYVPRSENEALACLLDAGYEEKISAKITTLRRYGNTNSRLRITIYLESLERSVVRRDLLRATTIDIDELRGLHSELLSRGTAYMRFDDMFYVELAEPAVGEKIVAVYNGTPDVAVLYLLQVVATGADCEKYVDDPKDLWLIDDCSPYILSNICGPVTINLRKSNSLKGMDLSNLSPTDYLSKEYSDRFKQIFDSVLSGIAGEDECRGRDK